MEPEMKPGRIPWSHEVTKSTTEQLTLFFSSPAHKTFLGHLLQSLTPHPAIPPPTPTSLPPCTCYGPAPHASHTGIFQRPALLQFCSPAQLGTWRSVWPTRGARKVPVTKGWTWNTRLVQQPLCDVSRGTEDKQAERCAGQGGRQRTAGRTGRRQTDGGMVGGDGCNYGRMDAGGRSGGGYGNPLQYSCLESPTEEPGGL